ncbi:MAG: FG-GAP-like repeat-containing protein, partial [Bacteroidetes bacterium]|nr:FG-GAP-like repeat-containing protein [Bacteroidota bacterium]
QIFKNKGKILNPENQSIQLQLIGKGKNTAAIGAQILITVGEEVFYTEQMPNRGFQSSVDPKITIGLGKVTMIDQIKVLWPDGAFTQLSEVPVNQLLTLKWAEAGVLPEETSFFQASTPPRFVKSTKPVLDFTHQENEFVDFDRDRLTYLMLSTEGPAVAKADVNGDGFDDLFFGGAKTFAGKLYHGSAKGSYRYLPQEAFELDALSEDTDALFFDADQDGDIDLFVTSGGNESGFGNPDLADRLYLNDGKGNFSKGFQTGNAGIFGSSTVAVPLDLNADGALDLVVGGRLIPFTYGAPADTQLWMNDGKGNFTEQSSTLAPDFKRLGLVTDAKVLDYDGDGLKDLVVVGEWMAPTFFKNIGNKLEKMTLPGLDKLKGWYQTVEIGDFNKDGKPDLALGNQGLNTRMKGSLESPIRLYVNDFDQNGSLEHLFTQQIQSVQIPFTLKHELERQVPSIKKNTYTTPTTQAKVFPIFSRKK